MPNPSLSPDHNQQLNTRKKTLKITLKFSFSLKTRVAAPQVLHQLGETSVRGPGGLALARVHRTVPGRPLDVRPHAGRLLPYGTRPVEAAPAAGQ